MRILVTDDESLQLNGMVSILRRILPDAEIFAYSWPYDALEKANECGFDIAFLDVQTGGMTGLELAAELKRTRPDMHIVFVTGYSKYAVDAFAVHATGYLLKPATEEAVRRELDFIYSEPQQAKRRIEVRTFGGFDVYVDGRPVRFGRAKSKELLAYLVDHRGRSVTTGEAYAALFEDAADTLSGKSYFRTIVYEMLNALKKVDADGMIEKGRNSYAVIPEQFDCDYYRFVEGDQQAVNAYQNDYLPSYSWAEMRNAELGFFDL